MWILFIISLILGLLSLSILKNLEVRSYDTVKHDYCYIPYEVKAIWVPIGILILLIPILNIACFAGLLGFSMVEAFRNDTRIKETSWMNKNL